MELCVLCTWTIYFKGIINKNNYLYNMYTMACYKYLKVGWESFKCKCGDTTLEGF